MVSYKDICKEELIKLLKTYIEPKYYNLHDWDIILENATINREWNEVWFNLCFFDLALDLDTLKYRDVTNIHGFKANGDE